MNNRANRQRGGVLAFVLIGVLLTALLAGGIFLSKRQGRAAATGEPTAVNTPAESTNTTKQAEPQKPAETTTKQDTPQQTTPKPTTPSTTSTTPVQPSVVATTGPSDIATTGPTETAFTIVGLSLITAAASAYRISVQRMRLAALK